MKSPFAGMDPYLEAHWLDVHASLAVYTRNQLRVQLPPGLVVRVEEYMSISEEHQQKNYSPDVRIHDRLNGAPSPPSFEGSVAVAEPLVIPMETEPMTLRSVRVLDTTSGERIVTAIEFLSPANKVGRVGRKQYKQKRDALIEATDNLVEIDLVRQGGYILAVDEESLPSDYRGPYRICVLRGGKRNQAELYRATYKERLPRIRIPLRENDRDAVLDVQELIDRAYEEGQYGLTIDYRTSPRPPLIGEDADWTNNMLREKGLRSN